MSTLVIGCGNPLRRDDGAGPHIAQRLSGVDTLQCHQLLPEHAERIAGATRLIVVDAAEGTVPGEIREIELHPGHDDADSNMHALTPAGLLALTEALYGVRPRATLLTVTGADFSHGEGLSPVVDAAAENAVRVIERMLNSD